MAALTPPGSIPAPGAPPAAPGAPPAPPAPTGGAMSAKPKADGKAEEPELIYDPERDIYINKFPFMSLECCENGRHFVACGGGGSAGKKEIGNEVRLYVYEPNALKPSNRIQSVDRINFGAVLPTRVTYSPQQDLWCVSAGPVGYVLEITDDEKLNTVHQFRSEFKEQLDSKGNVRIEQELMMMTSSLLLTAGSDQVARIWSWPEVKAEPRLEFTKHSKDIEGMDISADEKLAVTVSEDRTCRIWRTDNGEELHCINWLDPNSPQNPISLSIKAPTFFDANTLLLTGAGPRGPARIALYDLESGKQKYQAITDERPCSALKLNQSKTFMALGFGPGHKNAYAVDAHGFAMGAIPFRKVRMCGHANKPIHFLPVQAVGWLDSESALSVSGDYTIHIGPSKIASGPPPSKGNGCFCFCMLLFLILAGSIGFGIHYTNNMSLAEVQQFAAFAEKNKKIQEQRMNELLKEFHSEAKRPQRVEYDNYRGTEL